MDLCCSIIANSPHTFSPASLLVFYQHAVEESDNPPAKVGKDAAVGEESDEVVGNTSKSRSDYLNTKSSIDSMVTMWEISVVGQKILSQVSAFK